MKHQALANSRGPYKKSAEARQTIIQAAIEQLIEEGYREFSLRKIARRAGVSIGRVQHHFPNKEILLSMMLDDVISAYLEAFDSLIEEFEPPEEQLRAVVRHVVEDLGTKETTHFFPELWSLANHDPKCDQLSLTMYDKYQDVYRRIIPAINPELSAKQIETAALFFAASLEGHTMFVGYRKRYNERIDAIAEMAYRSFLNIIKTGVIPG